VDADNKNILDKYMESSLTVSEKTGKLQLVLTEDMYNKAKEAFGENCGYDKDKVQIWIYPKFD